MREILFRGKRTDNGEWVSGGSIVQGVEDGVRSAYMLQSNEKCTSIHGGWTDDILGFEDCRFYKVDGETICQFTGLKDKNGKPIFEGDIVEISGQRPYVVEFINGGFEPFVIKGWECEREADEYEIIGNIHDNPELLNGE